ncbi:MAG: glycine--tRNA ligase, partial [Minisyncoccales bacterium]
CQGIYLNFLNVQRSMRLKLPFGICQIGKAFRNEITPGHFLYRLREFEQMEFQWFCHPREADFWFDFWLKERLIFLEKIGLKKENLRVFEAPEKERAHYAKRQIDIEFHFPFGWKEIEGVHHRGDWDLSRHAQFSGNDLKYFDQEKNESFFPYVIETSVGLDRLFFALLCDAFEELPAGRLGQGKRSEIVLKLSPLIAPVEIAVLPLLQNNDKILNEAKEIFERLKKEFLCFYDQSGSIGRRYRRQDEIGTVFAVTVDFQTLEDRTVTIRERDSMKQVREKIDLLEQFFKRELREKNLI